MAIYKNTPPAIVSGSVLWLDAANTRSYPRSGNNWFDLLNNTVTGSIVNSGGFNTTGAGSIGFNGSNTGVQLSGSLLSLNQMTISSWNFSTNYIQSGFLFEKTTNGTVNTQYSLFYDSGGSMWYRTQGLSTTDLNVGIVAAGVKNNQWNNIVATFDGTNKRIYVNGAIAATSANLTGTVTANTTGPAYIGIYGSFAGYPFNGRIAVTQVFNRALSAQEIQQNYNALKSRFNIT